MPSSTLFSHRYARKASFEPLRTNHSRWPGSSAWSPPRELMVTSSFSLSPRMPRPVPWPAKDLAFYQSGFRNTYLPWVQQIVARYKDDPVDRHVGAHQHARRCRPVSPCAISSTWWAARFTGSIPTTWWSPARTAPGPTRARRGYAFIHASAGIDVASFRDYDTTHTEPPNLAPSLRCVGRHRASRSSWAKRECAPASTAIQRTSFNMMPCLSWSARKDRLESWLAAGFSTDARGRRYLELVTATEQTTASGCQYDTAPNDPLIKLVHDFPIP